MKNKTLNLLTAAVMILLLAAPVGALPDPGGAQAPVVDDAVVVERAPDAPSAEPAMYIVLLEGASLSSYQGGIPGLEATNPAVHGETKLDAKSPASLTYLDYLAGQHAQFIDRMEQALGHSVDVLYRYDAVLNGLAVRLSAREAKVVTGLPGVLRVERDFMRQLDTDAGPVWIGAGGIWDGSATGEMSMGEGAPMKMSAAAKKTPMRISSQGRAPEMMPLAITAMRPACGAGSLSPPMPMPPVAMSLLCSRVMTSTSTTEAASTPMIPPTSMRQGVPPRL